MVALAPRPDSELVPSPGAVLQWRCRRLQRKGQSDHQTGVWVPHLRGTGSRFVSRTWRPARTKTHPQILLTRLEQEVRDSVPERARRAIARVLVAFAPKSRVGASAAGDAPDDLAVTQAFLLLAFRACCAPLRRCHVEQYDFAFLPVLYVVGRQHSVVRPLGHSDVTSRCSPDYGVAGSGHYQPAFVLQSSPAAAGRDVAGYYPAPLRRFDGSHHRLAQLFCRSCFGSAAQQNGVASPQRDRDRCGQHCGRDALVLGCSVHRADPLRSAWWAWSRALRQAAPDAPDWCLAGFVRRVSPRERGAVDLAGHGLS